MLHAIKRFAENVAWCAIGLTLVGFFGLLLWFALLGPILEGFYEVFAEGTTADQVWLLAIILCLLLTGYVEYQIGWRHRAGNWLTAQRIILLVIVGLVGAGTIGLVLAYVVVVPATFMTLLRSDFWHTLTWLGKAGVIAGAVAYLAFLYRIVRAIVKA